LRRILALFALVLAVLAIGTAPAGAITGNFSDDNIHTYVALIAFYDKNDVFTHRCSGSLITPSVFLTAGHCTDATTGATTASRTSPGSRTRTTSGS
jgi:Trypsin